MSVEATGLQQIVVPRAEGTSFTVQLCRAADEAAPVVLVVPAMGMKARYYLGLIQALAAAGVHGAVSEQRGHEAHGGRRAGWGYDYGYAELVEDLRAAVAVVRGALPGAPVHLLGHSLGGQIAIAYAGTGGELDGLILMASSTPYWKHWRSPAIRAAGYLFPMVSRIVGHYPGERLGFAGRESRGLMRDWGVLARTGRLVLGEEGLADVAVPVLAVSVEGDALGVPEAVDALVAKLPASTATREHLAHDGIDHFRWAKRPEVVVPLIARWVGVSG